MAQRREIGVRRHYKVKKATLLANQIQLKYAAKNGQIIIEVPATAPDSIASVIKLELREKLTPIKLVSNNDKTFKIADE